MYLNSLSQNNLFCAFILLHKNVIVSNYNCSNLRHHSSKMPDLITNNLNRVCTDLLYMVTIKDRFLYEFYCYSHTCFLRQGKIKKESDQSL